MRRALVCLSVVLMLPGASPRAATDADPINGRWDRDDGLGGIEIRPCDDALCGTIVWLRDRDTPAHVGQRVLYGMRQSGADRWSGSALNPEDGRTYAGTMTVSGAHLQTRGCIFGGLICRSVALTRPLPR